MSNKKKITSRREARERAVQFLFQHDLNPSENLAEALRHFWESQSPSALLVDRGPALWGEKKELPPPSASEDKIRFFADRLIHGVLEHQEEIDGQIRTHAHNWDFKRIAVLDRNILRLAIHEMLHHPEIPPVVSIHEAVEIAKRFSTEESGRFVNGILDRIKAGLGRPDRTPSEN